ncbi:uncharacterized protein V6R79_020155 [Siganus canaliculatus]
MSEEEAAGPSTDLYRWSEHKRSNSPTPSDVSLRSDMSQPQPLNINSENPGWNESKRSNSPTPSNASLKSDMSKDQPVNFNKGDPGDVSSVSANSSDSNRNQEQDSSKDNKKLKKTFKTLFENELKNCDTEIYEIKDGKINTKGPLTFANIFKKSAQTVLLQGVAGIGKTFQAKRFMAEWGKGKTNKDIDFIVPLNFSELKTGRGKNQSMNNLIHDSIADQSRGFKFDDCKLTFIIDSFEKLNLDFKNNEDLTDMKKPASMEVLLTNLIRRNLLPSAHVWIISRPEAVKKIPAEFINRVTECRETSLRWEKLTSALKQSLKEENITIDINDPKVKNTEHIMRENESSEVNGEETKSQVISWSKLFKEAKGQTVRTVLTVGEAGIGKSCCVQRFIKDWANESKSFLGRMWDSVATRLWKAKEAEPLIFPLNISKLNQMRRKTEKKNLMELLNHFFKETKKYVISDIEQLKVIFILDGLDVYQPPLDLDNNNTVNDVRMPASVDDLLTNLIKGTLFPSARIWITSRQKLSHECISRTTEIRWKPDYASQQMLKSQMKEQFTLVSEGIDKQKASAVLKDIYTDLYIIEGERGEVNQLNEVKQAQDAKFKPVTEETSIKYHDIFKPAANQDIRTVLTIGLAGIGKTFATMKYMLDWAEGERYENVYFMFSLSFRELNLRKDEKHSLEGLIQSFYPGLRISEITNFDKYKMLIVLDGFDECRLELDFTKTPNHPRNVKDEMDVNDLLTNVIQGNLLPKAQIWITSRPAASNNIPAAKVDRVTEVRGFNEEQKEEYFRKRFSDKELAERILTHLKKSRSLYIMCHIPVFCWITSTVLEDLFQRNEEEKMPKTLTDMYIYFLLLQCKQANVKYGDEPGQSSESDSCWNVTNRKMVTSLGRLAFEALEEGNLVFKEDDLTKCGVDVTEVAGVSGLLTQIKRETSGLYPQKMFCFVHLSIQEFLAAFYVFYMFNNEGQNLLTKPASEVRDSPAYEFYKMAVDKALGSKNGDWDLFIRFLLGLSLETNQKLFQELLTETKTHTETNKKTIEYIKEKIREDNSDPDQNCNLFHCLNELNDHTLVKEIKGYLSSDTVNFENFTKSQWSALTFVLLTSDENLDVFDLKKYLKSEKVLLGMLPVVKVSQKALLSWCELSEESCLGLSSSVLSYASSNLTELDLSHNDLKDSGVEKLADGLKSIHCKLEILKLAGCQVSEEGCSSLASALTSKAASSLKLLDLSYNDPGDKWKTKLTAIADDSKNSLKTLCLDRCGKHCLQPGLKKYGVDLRLDRNTASRRLKVLEGDRTATTKQTVEERLTQRRSEDGFRRTQVSCGEGLKGLCYWEVKWKGSVGIAVAYGNVSNEWDSSGGLGCNDMSWSLRCSKQGYSALHGKSCKKINMECYDKIAVFLDWEGGTLTYYGVKEGKLSLIHKFTEKFTEPLIPCFWFKKGIVTLWEI